MAVTPPGFWWREEAACLRLDPELFYDLDDTSRAKSICRSCDVSEDCLADALTRGERFGVWGGLDEVERRALARETCGTPDRYQVERCRCAPCARAYAAKRARARELERALVALMDAHLAGPEAEAV